MNDLEIIREEIQTVFPNVRAVVDAPDDPNTPWFLDLFLDQYDATVEWRPGIGYGITSDEDHGLGEGPDEFYQDRREAIDRVLSLLKGRNRTEPPRPVRMGELRKLCGLSQEEVARKMGLKQGNVSKLESRNDLLLSTLREYAVAVGGKLIVKIALPDRTEREIFLEPCEEAI